MTATDQEQFLDLRFFVLCFNELQQRIRLLPVSMVFFVIIVMVIYPFLKPTYVAEAIIGPLAPSPINSFMSNFDGNGSAGSIAKKVLGGSSNNYAGSDPFQQYLQVLQSKRLARVLIENDHIDRILFKERWDAKANRWHPPGYLHTLLAPIKLALHRPSKDAPDLDDVTQFLSKNMSISSSEKQIGSKIPSLLSSSSSYPKVSLTYDNPVQAQALLNMILLRADNILRQEMRQNVDARLIFLNNESNQVMTADQKVALIGVLSGQQQLKMMLNVDEHYAANMIDPPYASNVPVSPAGPFTFLLVGMVVGLTGWAGLVILSLKSRWLYVAVSKIDGFWGGAGKR